MLRAERSHTVLSNIADRRKRQATGSRYITYMWTNLEKGTWNGYDGRFPVERIKNSVFKRPAPGQPFVQGQKGHPSDERARTMARGVCLLVCALFTQRQPPTMRQKTLSFLPLCRAPSEISAWTSPRCIVGPFERSQPIGPAHDDFIMKNRNVRVDRTPF